MRILLKRAYEPPSKSDGARVLVERLWPRGLTKADAAVKTWLRDVAPSNELRRWFHANPKHWATFRKRYIAELRNPEAEKAFAELHDIAEANATVTLVFASRDVERNNAIVLKDLLEGKKKPPASSGQLRAARAQRARAQRPR